MVSHTRQLALYISVLYSVNDGVQARSQPFFPFKPARYSELSMRDFSQVAWPQEPQLRYHVVRNGSLWAGGMMYATGPYVLQWVHASEY